MTTRDAVIETFLANTEWETAQHFDLAGDASARRYKRLELPNGNTAVLMDAPVEGGNGTEQFANMAVYLTAKGLSAPKIYLQVHSQGLLLLEDLGDDLFARVIPNNPGTEVSLYTAAANVLTVLHQHTPPSGLRQMDAATLAEMIEPLFSWYVAGADRPWQQAWETFHNAIAPILKDRLGTPDVLVLRDYHAENLLWLPDRDGVGKVGLLDFQDALQGHKAYDLVSLLQDARRDVPVDVERQTKAHFVHNAGLDPQSFDVAYALLGAQRNLRIVGVFARLCMHYGKPHYVDMIPRVYDLAMRNLRHPILKEPADILAGTLPAPTQDILEKLKSKCATIPTP
ncbi:MAG: phosphotransferase [Shimia sp.]|uniref:aminoglycoside phosphotransferase family protein n=1 Tax=Shimia sp. TaxID=1954381 RepID=UPI0025FDC9BC|nr:phosphotransferase [Shimia sp.]MCH2066960.1 phosphotransferase [Shimia sp.]